jgi:hypothetical protein
MRSSFFIKLVTLISLWAVPSAAFSISAYAQSPFRCGPDCGGGGGDDPYYKVAVSRSTIYTNYQVHGGGMTAAYWNDLAAKIQAWKTEADGNGSMLAIQNFILKNASVLEAATFNSANLVPTMQTLGYQGTISQLEWVLNKWTQAQRIALVQQVQKYGYDYVVATAILDAQSIAKGLALREPFDMCHFAGGGAAWFTFAAAASALIGQEEVAIPLAFIGATFALAGWEDGCY